MNSSANGINHGYMYNKGYRWLITLEDGRTLYGKTLLFCSELMRTDFKDEKNFAVTSLYNHTDSKWAQSAFPLMLVQRTGEEEVARELYGVGAGNPADRILLERNPDIKTK